MSVEDLFSRRSREYARFRPRYGPELFEWLAALAPGRQLAWDSGTGSGQAALGLAAEFERIVATDASAEQIAHAEAHPRIEYRVARAEDVELAPASVDLVSVAAAIHWFDLDPFYAVVRRALRPRGVIAAWTYHMPEIAPAVDRVVERYYAEVLGAYWPERFHYVAAHYRTLPFPFEEIEPPPFALRTAWTLPQFMGFASSWSAAQRYFAERAEDPITGVAEDLARAWGDPEREREIRWPLYLRVGRT